ncbi:MAG: hypothetical protein LAP21_12675 [Acidobacteriia bacterium]|nr:hypothetical protein [Terriglobia bacterium]
MDQDQNAFTAKDAKENQNPKQKPKALKTQRDEAATKTLHRRGRRKDGKRTRCHPEARQERALSSARE